METIKIRGEYIQLNQLLKFLGWSENGADANEIIDTGAVKVNGETTLKRRHKIVAGNVVSYEDKKVTAE